MKTRCPACGATTSLDALLGHSEASKAFLAAINLVGDLAKPMIQYLGMFRSDSRDLTFDRASKLLNELAADIMQSRSSAVITFSQRPKLHGCGLSTRLLNDVIRANCNCRLKITATYMKCLLHINPNMHQFRIQSHVRMQQLRLR